LDWIFYLKSFAGSNAARFRISDQIKLIIHTASDFDVPVFIPGFLRRENLPRSFNWKSFFKA
jgi:hypothetical protein